MKKKIIRKCLAHLFKYCTYIFRRIYIFRLSHLLILWGLLIDRWISLSPSLALLTHFNNNNNNNIYTY